MYLSTRLTLLSVTKSGPGAWGDGLVDEMPAVRARGLRSPAPIQKLGIVIQICYSSTEGLAETGSLNSLAGQPSPISDLQIQ